MTDKISGAVECVQNRPILNTEFCPIKFRFIQIISMPYVNLTCKLKGTVTLFGKIKHIGPSKRENIMTAQP